MSNPRLSPAISGSSRLNVSRAALLLLGALLLASCIPQPGVRLRLYAAAPGAAPQLIDSVAPYQIFFSQLGAELGEPVALPKEDNLPGRPRPISPSISGV